MKLLTEQRLHELADELCEIARRVDDIRSGIWKSYDSSIPSLDLIGVAIDCRSAANYMYGILPPSTPKLRRMQAKEARSGTASELAAGDPRCPWCGKPWHGVKLDGNGTPVDPHWYAVTCRTCGAQGPRHPTPEGAEAAWRERTTSKGR